MSTVGPYLDILRQTGADEVRLVPRVGREANDDPLHKRVDDHCLPEWSSAESAATR